MGGGVGGGVGGGGVGGGGVVGGGVGGAGVGGVGVGGVGVGGVGGGGDGLTVPALPPPSGLAAASILTLSQAPSAAASSRAQAQQRALGRQPTDP